MLGRSVLAALLAANLVHAAGFGLAKKSASSTPSKTCSVVIPTATPSGSICGGMGILKKPYLIARLPDESESNPPDACEGFCAANKKCLSFSLNATSFGCRLYSKPIEDMKFKNRTQNALYFFDKKCFKKQCSTRTPPPTTTPTPTPTPPAETFTTPTFTATTFCGGPSPVPEFLLQVSSPPQYAEEGLFAYYGQHGSLAVQQGSAGAAVFNFTDKCDLETNDFSAYYEYYLETYNSDSTASGSLFAYGSKSYGPTNRAEPTVCHIENGTFAVTCENPVTHATNFNYILNPQGPFGNLRLQPDSSGICGSSASETCIEIEFTAVFP